MSGDDLETERHEDCAVGRTLEKANSRLVEVDTQDALALWNLRT